MFTYEASGEMEPGNVYLQIKATTDLKVLRDGKTISFSIDWRDIALWRQEPMPVILVVHDVVHEVAYWLYMQQRLETSARYQAMGRSGSITIHLNMKNIVNVQAIDRFRRFKQKVLSQTTVVKHYG